jgi:activating signal cointegrator complex subunit 2
MENNVGTECKSILLLMHTAHKLLCCQPRKDKILQKHEFTGNRSLPPSNSLPGKQSSKSDSGRGAHRGGRGRGGLGGSNSGGGTHSDPPSQDREQRARNERQKSRQANHNRKRGHDRKMARGGMPV